MTYVYRDYDQAALNFQYDNQAQVSDPGRYIAWYSAAAEAVRGRVRHLTGISYGSGPDQKLDLFLPDHAATTDCRPVVVFIHGGAWKALGRTQGGFAAETFTRRGALYVALGFSLLPAAGSLDEMVAQVRTGIAFVRGHIARYGGDPARICIAGHSSGAHLAAMCAVTEWGSSYALPQDMIQAAAVISGMYDLEPVRLSYRNEMLRLDRGAAARNSPSLNLPSTGVPLLVGLGELETDEFKRQSTEFHQLWHSRFGNSRLMEVQGHNHYSVAETLAEPESQLSNALVDHFRL